MTERELIQLYVLMHAYSRPETLKSLFYPTSDETIKHLVFTDEQLALSKEFLKEYAMNQFLAKELKA